MTFPKTPRSRLKRVPKRGHYDHETVYAVLDAGMIAHVGMALEGQPVVIPVNYARMGDEIVFHGAKASRRAKYVRNGGEVCVTVTHLDGLVLARSAFHHAVNYRSVVAFGKGRIIDDLDEKYAALKAISEHMLPGRWDEVREPNKKEMNATTVIAIKIEEASAKIRNSPPGDEEEDYALDVWAGTLPVRQTYGTPEPDSRLKAGIPIPEYIQKVIPSPG